ALQSPFSWCPHGRLNTLRLKLEQAQCRLRGLPEPILLLALSTASRTCKAIGPTRHIHLCSAPTMLRGSSLQKKKWKNSLRKQRRTKVSKRFREPSLTCITTSLNSD